MTTIVFLGPSLNLGEAKAILPDALFLSPIACGDLIQVLELKPKKIVIIDGYFENCASIWHKEILYAISCGVLVYGASSMGALRAAELSQFGMIGIGRIYEQYQSGELMDDDEVVLTHSVEQLGFGGFTVPMVNVRATINQAVISGVIDKDSARVLLQQAKAMYYQERSLGALEKECKDLKGAEFLFEWWRREGYVDQKKIDAISVLEAVKLAPIEAKSLKGLANTALLRSLKIESLTKGFYFFDHFLPESYKISHFGKLFGSNYGLSKQLAKAIAVAHEIGVLEFRGQEVLLLNTVNDAIASNFLKLLDVDSENVVGKRSLELLGDIVARVYAVLKPHYDTVLQDEILTVTNAFYKKNKICSQEDFVEWLKAKNMGLDEFKFAMELLYFYDHFILKNNASTLFVAKSTEDVNYFNVALSLNGLDYEIISSLCNRRADLVQVNKNKLVEEGDYYAIRQDFKDAQEMRRALENLANLDLSALNAWKPVSWQLKYTA
ncbi:MAG: TfuA-like protein [Gammaproteobacteria bacterium]|nr:TfuA-like protein [Gammaproteobacteria bacterium]